MQALEVSSVSEVLVDFLRLLSATDSMQSSVTCRSTGLQPAPDEDFGQFKKRLRFQQFVRRLEELLLELEGSAAAEAEDPTVSSDSSLTSESLQKYGTAVGALRYKVDELLTDAARATAVKAQEALTREEVTKRPTPAVNRGATNGVPNRKAVAPRQSRLDAEQVAAGKRKADEHASSISDMANNLKMSANEVNRSLKNQTALLENTEGVAAKNLDKVRRETERVGQTLRRKRRAMCATWMTMATVAVTFISVYIFIILPFDKRRGFGKPRVSVARPPPSIPPLLSPAVDSSIGMCESGVCGSPDIEDTAAKPVEPDSRLDSGAVKKERERLVSHQEGREHAARKIILEKERLRAAEKQKQFELEETRRKEFEMRAKAEAAERDALERKRDADRRAKDKEEAEERERLAREIELESRQKQEEEARALAEAAELAAIQKKQEADKIAKEKALAAEQERLAKDAELKAKLAKEQEERTKEVERIKEVERLAALEEESRLKEEARMALEAEESARVSRERSALKTAADRLAAIKEKPKQVEDVPAVSVVKDDTVQPPIGSSAKQDVPLASQVVKPESGAARIKRLREASAALKERLAKLEQETAHLKEEL